MHAGRVAGGRPARERRSLRFPGKSRLYRTAARWQRFAQRLFAMNPRQALTACMLLFGAIAALDYVTPPQLNLTFLYVFVILLACTR